MYIIIIVLFNMLEMVFVYKQFLEQIQNVTLITNETYRNIILYVDFLLTAQFLLLCYTLFCLYTERFTFIAMNLMLNFGKSCLYTKFASLAIQEVPYLHCTKCLCYRQCSKFRHN